MQCLKDGQSCPALHKTKGPENPEYINGWTQKDDGPMLAHVRKGNAVFSEEKQLDHYCVYCLATPKGKKIGHKATWTGSTPKWCPQGRG